MFYLFHPFPSLEQIHKLSILYNCFLYLLFYSSTNVKFHATNALLNSLEFIRANFEKEVSENCLLWIVHQNENFMPFQLIID